MLTRRIIGISLGAVLLGSANLAVTAHAWVGAAFGCRFDPKNDDDGLGIGYNSTNLLAAMRDNTTSSSQLWNSQMNFLEGGGPQFTIVSYGSSTRDVRVEFSTSLPSNVGAQTTRWCGSDHYSQDPLFTWNRSATYYSRTTAHYRAIATHELGHTYGLDHNNTAGCDEFNAGLMYTDAVGKNDSCGWTAPTEDDTDGAYIHHYGLG